MSAYEKHLYYSVTDSPHLYGTTCIFQWASVMFICNVSIRIWKEMNIYIALKSAIFHRKS